MLDISLSFKSDFSKRILRSANYCVCYIKNLWFWVSVGAVAQIWTG